MKARIEWKKRKKKIKKRERVIRQIQRNNKTKEKKKCQKLLTPHCTVPPNFRNSFNEAVPHHLFMPAALEKRLLFTKVNTYITQAITAINHKKKKNKENKEKYIFSTKLFYCEKKRRKQKWNKTEYNWNARICAYWLFNTNANLSTHAIQNGLMIWDTWI